MFSLLNKGMMIVMMFTLLNMAQGAEVEWRELTYKGNEQAWQFVGDPWQTNDAGELLVPAAHVHSREEYVAFNTERAYGDCVITAKFRILYAGGALPELIVRSLDSRHFYAVRLGPLMTSIWKGGADGYQRMLAYRRGVGSYQRYMDKWCEVRVECVGPEILVFIEDSFVSAVRDEEYPAGVVGVGCVVGQAAWKDLTVAGRSVELQPAWSVVEAQSPQQITLFRRPTPGGMGAVNAHSATLLPGDELLVSYGLLIKRWDEWEEWVTRSRDYGLTWDEPVQGRGGRYLPSRDELWWFDWEHYPEIVWEDDGTDSDEQKPVNFSIGLSRSKDGGRTWSEKERLYVPFPSGRACAPFDVTEFIDRFQQLDKADVILGLALNAAELSDGSIAFTGEFWRSTKAEWAIEGENRSSQVQFMRTTDGGQTWSISPVDVTEWQRNESSWVELADGELLCIMRSNHESHLGLSRSRDKGQTWSRIVPVIPFFGSSAPSLLRTRDNILILAGRNWGLLTSLDGGHSWSLPTYIGGYSGSGWPAHLLEMPDGRILVVGDDDEQMVKAQFITVDREGIIHPASPGPAE